MTDRADFEAPGPGQWALDRSHFPGGTTPILQWLMTECMHAGMEDVFAEIGVPASHVQAEFVHGFMYTRLVPLIGGDRQPGRLPPSIVLKAVTRLHPAFRARTKVASTTLTGRAFVDVLEHWDSTLRPQAVEQNRAFGAVDVEKIDDTELDAHVGELIDHNRRLSELHFYLHGHDLGPIARYLHDAIGWGLEPADAVSALTGASPSTSRPLERLVEIRALVEASGTEPNDLTELRNISPEVSTLVDEHLDHHGDVLATGYDITAFTLRELPGVLLNSITAATLPNDSDAEAIAERLRLTVSPEHREQFDAHLADARLVMDMRDDNGPVTVEWPLGLLRRALLEVGRRLTSRGALTDVEHVFELHPAEARTALTGRIPQAAALADRADQRHADAALTPPPLLGPDEPQPPLDVMPEALAELIAMVQTAIDHLGMDGSTATDPNVGVGIGTRRYSGRARVATSADEAIEKLEPGDVLVVRATSPAYNAVLMVAGAVVTADGGALSHAAVLARELDIPAVVGASGALEVPDGATVTVDPVAGRVSVGVS